MDIWGNAFLCDFGLSRIRHEIDRTLTSVRTGGRGFFVAPEIYSADILRSAESCDVYSLAITIYVLGTNTRGNPFGAEGRSTHVAMSGWRPPCPDSLGGLDKQDTGLLYGLLRRMWSSHPAARTNAADIEHSLETLATRLTEEFRQFEPISYPHTLHVDDFYSKSKQLVDEYQWRDPAAGIYLIESFDPFRREAVVGKLVYAIMSAGPEEQPNRLNHMVNVIQLGLRHSKAFRPGLFYYGIRNSLAATPGVNWTPEHQKSRHVATLLFAIGVSRFRVADMCVIAFGGNRLIMESWDYLCNKYRGTKS